MLCSKLRTLLVLLASCVFGESVSAGSSRAALEVGIPTEPLGFSGGFKVSLFSGVPDFDDLKFEFTAKSRPLAIVVE